MKSGVFNCGWGKAGRKFKVWLMSNPGLTVEAPDLDTASDDMAELLLERMKVDDVVVELVPPPITKNPDAGWTRPHLLSLGYNEFAETNHADPEMYSGGVCQYCHRPLGERTAVPLTLKSRIRGDIAATTFAPGVDLLCENFFELLTTDERSRIQLREVWMPKGSRRTFWELTGDSLAPWVSFFGARHSRITCWVCPVCKGRKLNPQHPRLEAYKFISRSDYVKAGSPECFVAGSVSEGLSICMTSARWKSVAGKPGTAGIATSLVALVDDDVLVRNPSLPGPPKSD